MSSTQVRKAEGRKRGCRAKSNGCGGGTGGRLSLSAAVNDYRENHRAGAREERRQFVILRTLPDVIRAAAKSEDEDEYGHRYRHPHQRRIRGTAINRATRALLNVIRRIQGCGD